MSGGSNVHFPGPSPQEEQLQSEQTALLRQQRDILGATDFHFVVAEHVVEPGGNAPAAAVVSALDQIGHPPPGRGLRRQHYLGAILIERAEDGCRRSPRSAGAARTP